MQAKKLLFFLPKMTIGGAQRFVANALEALEAYPCDVALAIHGGEIELPISKDVSIFRLGTSNTKWDYPAAILKLRKLLGIYRPHTLFSVGTTCNLQASFAVSSLHIRWIARIGNPPYVTERRIRGPFASVLYGQAARCVSPSEDLTATYQRWIPHLASKFITLPNCARLESLVPHSNRHAESTSPPVMVVVSRLTEQKRPDLILKTFLKVRKQIHVRLLVVGDGILRGWMEEEARRHNVCDDITFVGAVPDPSRWYRKDGIFLALSDYEGMSHSLIEAQMEGMPAVVTDCDFGNREVVVDGVTGFLVPPGDAEAAADKALLLLRERRLRDTMALAAEYRARNNFSLHGFGEKLARILGI